MAKDSGRLWQIGNGKFLSGGTAEIWPFGRGAADTVRIC
jgi:hypothetical protein